MEQISKEIAVFEKEQIVEVLNKYKLNETEMEYIVLKLNNPGKTNIELSEMLGKNRENNYLTVVLNRPEVKLCIKELQTTKASEQILDMQLLAFKKGREKLEDKNTSEQGQLKLIELFLKLPTAGKQELTLRKGNEEANSPYDEYINEERIDENDES